MSFWVSIPTTWWKTTPFPIRKTYVPNEQLVLQKTSQAMYVASPYGDTKYEIDFIITNKTYIVKDVTVRVSKLE